MSPFEEKTFGVFIRVIGVDMVQFWSGSAWNRGLRTTR